MNISDSVLLRLFMRSSYKYNTAYALWQVLKRYRVFETTQNVLIDANGPNTTLSGLLSYKILKQSSRYLDIYQLYYKKCCITKTANNKGFDLTAMLRRIIHYVFFFFFYYCLFVYLFVCFVLCWFFFCLFVVFFVLFFFFSNKCT